MTNRFARFARFARCALAAMLLAAPVAAAAADPVQVTSRTEADGTTTLTHEALIDAPVADVWTAISTPQGWMAWAVPVAWMSAGDPDIMETSYDPADKPGSPSTIQQRFLARIPERALAFRTVKAPQGFPNWESYRLVTSLFELEAVGAKTRLRLISTGYPASEAGKALVAFFTAGNSLTLESLQKRFVEGPVDWSKR